MLIRVFFSGIAAAAFGVIFQIRGRNIFYAALSGVLSYAVYLAALSLGGVYACFLSSAATSMYAELMARRRKATSTLFLVAGLIPIVPGGGMYRCTVLALEGLLNEAVIACYGTLLEAGAIAIGIIAVSSVVKLIPRKYF